MLKEIVWFLLDDTQLMAFCICVLFIYESLWKVTFRADVFLESVADQHQSRLTEDKKKSAEVDPHQLREGEDVYLDKKSEC